VSDLRKALAQVAAEDAAAVLAEAREGARVRARELIEDALVDEIVSAAAALRMAQPRAAAGEALWAYCVLAAADAGSLPAITGIEGDASVECLVEGDLAALVSAVPLAEYGDERLREHLNDIDWVERTARRHEAVLEAALPHCTIVPLRLCTLFRDRDGVRKLLRDENETMRAALETLDGRAEWGLKIFADSSRVAAPGAGGHDGDGTGYLNRKQRERDARAALSETIAAYAAEAHERMTGLADAARTNPVQRPEAHGRAADMVLNGVYLVRLEREAELMRVVGELRRRWAPEGVELELSGPGPGYIFVAGAEGVTP
jgi:hypothetical protein